MQAPPTGSPRRPAPLSQRRRDGSVYLLVMPPGIAQLIEAIHQPGADVPALFRAHDSEIHPAV